MTIEVRSCEGCAVAGAVSRREFVSQATLTAVALALTACGGGGGDGGSTGPANPPSPPVIATPLVITLSNFPALQTVGAAVLVSSVPALALARTPAGIVGYSLECTHAGSTVNINQNYSLRCPNHGAEFAYDGTWTGGTQQTTSLFRVTVTPDAAGATVSITT